MALIRRPAVGGVFLVITRQQALRHVLNVRWASTRTSRMLARACGAVWESLQLLEHLLASIVLRASIILAVFQTC